MWNHSRSLVSLASLRFPLRRCTPSSWFSSVSEAGGDFPGASAPFTSSIDFIKGNPPMPVYRVLALDGTLLNASGDPQWGKEKCIALYEKMLLLNELDHIMYKAQRHGQISFYMTNYGEEATQIGSSEALEMDDVIFAQYREAGVLMHRGFPLDRMLAQLFSSEKDLGKGRQMPVHYGSRELNFQTISSPLGTQIPQASGAAYALKRAGKPNIVACYFGEGAASEGDFHAALNFSATLECPVVFFCRNNGYAISTPAHEQYRGDGIVARGLGYGIRSVRVDGNDIFAVYQVMKAARKEALENKAPILIEAMTYRGGHHSTSDDASRYRSSEELKLWMETPRNPIRRFRLYLEGQGWWNAEKEKKCRTEAFDTIIAEMDRAENDKKVPFEELFNDVYGSEPLPVSLVRQREDLINHLQKYGDRYPSLDGSGQSSH